MRWIGIDEAGYGPNLGPMVMAAVAAEGPGPARPDLWGDCALGVCRAGVRGPRLWVDDSKRLYRGGVGLDRLEAAALAAIDACGLPGPGTLSGLLRALGVDPEREAELRPWIPEGGDPPVPRPSSAGRVASAIRLGAFSGRPWRIEAIRGVVLGPRRFNHLLGESGSKASVHASAFAGLLRWAWDRSADGEPTLIRGDKHGGRHFYGPLIRAALPPCSVVAEAEGPGLSRYAIRGEGRAIAVELLPRADADDGLVALASIACKLVREHWMAAFNAYWASRVPGLKASAGYPVDAARFRRELLDRLPEPDPPPSCWWRQK
ncbi:ribonuclease H family protein [Tautonia plasticadhaerens]|uniref:Uncharacterized protein n=1 Tax=Tautonia plasticadhaerens TaxID=2527974 RepID=A0A518H0W6_9BACT|nr:hypothetical protein [Tautonia plasticadhaerens]QDV34471.1 Hypothetical protein ElP_23600 [Tautonia plasticadhaerens]